MGGQHWPLVQHKRTASLSFSPPTASRYETQQCGHIAPTDSARAALCAAVPVRSRRFRCRGSLSQAVAGHHKLAQAGASSPRPRLCLGGLLSDGSALAAVNPFVASAQLWHVNGPAQSPGCVVGLSWAPRGTPAPPPPASSAAVGRCAIPSHWQAAAYWTCAVLRTAGPW